MSLSAFCGIWRFDGQPASENQLIQSAFKSPNWQSDHQAILIQGALGFASTQRLIVPEDAEGPMPYEHPASGCIIVADSYLLYKQALADQLDLPHPSADCRLILSAYLKWGRDCTRRLSGEFSFAIWDPRERRFFSATDRLGKRPFFYAFQPGRHFVFANTMAPFRVLCPGLSINDNLMFHFTLDSFPAGETCYREVGKVPAAHQLAVTANGILKGSYWKLRDQKRALPYKKKEDYYRALREIFSAAVLECTRSDYPIQAHISGGLDSSSVASMAAKLLAEKNRSLFGYTSIPQDLEGPSYRSGWRYHEIPMVREVLSQYPGIDHYTFRTNPITDPFEELKVFYPWTDWPYRNVSNFPWFLAGLQRTFSDGGRVALIGDHGNATISFAGQTIREKILGLLHAAKIWAKPGSLYNGYFDNHHPQLLKSGVARHLLRNSQLKIGLTGTRYFLLNNETSPLLGSIRPMSLWHGVEMLDPTSDIKLVEFCYNVPQWVYCRRPNTLRRRPTLERRLLVREALAGIVPEAIRHNPYRGEQAADWHLQYNHHVRDWREKLERISPAAQTRLWQWYDKAAMFRLFDKYSFIEHPSYNAALHAGANLMRCLSLGFYLDYLERNTP